MYTDFSNLSGECLDEDESFSLEERNEKKERKQEV